MADPLSGPMGSGPDPVPLVAEPTAATPDPYRPPQIEAILRQLREVVANARPMPLSASSMVNKDELLGLLDEAAARLPEELRAASGTGSGPLSMGPDRGSAIGSLTRRAGFRA